MDIEITKEEYRNLLDLLYIARWVLNAHKPENELGPAKYDEIIQKFYSLAGEMGHGELIEYDTRRRKFFPARSFEETSRAWDLIDEFTDNTFWTELIDRLTARDVERQEGDNEKLRSLSVQNRYMLEAPIREMYTEEFAENGLNRLEIVEEPIERTWKSLKTSD